MDDTQNDAKNLDKTPSTWPGRYPGPHNARPNNRHALRHGGEGTLKRITAGQEFTGPARDAEIAVYNELAHEGRASIVLRLAVRLTAACDLFHNAMVDAAENDDLEKMDRYVKRFGWLAASSLRAWAQVATEEKDVPPGLDYEHLLRQEQGSNDG